MFGNSTLSYLKNIVQNGQLDYLIRLPEDVLLKIVAFLSLEDISRLSQVNCMFRQVKIFSYLNKLLSILTNLIISKICRSDKVWIELYKKYYSNTITNELYELAERDGWRKLFFTNKIKLLVSNIS